MTGRPPKYPHTPEGIILLQSRIDDYFAIAKSRTIKQYMKDQGLIDIPSPAPIHITGLCVHLDICRDTLCEMQKLDLFSDPISRAKQICESYAATQCFEGQKGNKADFVLKNNFKQNWGDEQIIKHTGSIDHKHDITEDLLSAFNKLKK